MRERAANKATGTVQLEVTREEAARVKRFLALPPQLQEGCLQYAEKIRLSYGK